MCKNVLEGDYPESDCVPAPKLMESVMTNCRGARRVVGPFVELALRRIGTAELPYFKDLLMMTFAHALHYDPAVALAATNRLGQTNHAPRCGQRCWRGPSRASASVSSRRTRKGLRARSHGGVARARRRAHARDSRVFERHRGFARVAARRFSRKSRKERRTRRAASDDYRGKSRTTTSTMSQSTTRRTTGTMIYSSTPPRSRHWRKRRRTPIRVQRRIWRRFRRRRRRRRRRLLVR